MSTHHLDNVDPLKAATAAHDDPLRPPLMPILGGLGSRDPLLLLNWRRYDGRSQSRCFTLRCMSKGRRTAAVAALGAATIAWLAVGAGYVIVLVSRQIGGDILFCGDRPRGSSQYGDASWQWWYPGTRCTYAPDGASSGLVTKPSTASGLLSIGLVVWAALIVGAAVRLARDDDDARGSQRAAI